MPCRCTGVRLEKCDCGVYGSQSVHRRKEELLAPTRVHTSGRSHGLFAKKNRSILTIVVERLYEKCAGYNLRYCPFRGFVGNDNYLSNTLRDLVLLCCFLLANFVVFMMIFTRMSVQLIFLIFESAKWVRRIVSTSRSNLQLNNDGVVSPRFEEDSKFDINAVKSITKEF